MTSSRSILGCVPFVCPHTPYESTEAATGSNKDGTRGATLYVSGWSPDSRSIVSGEDGVVALVDVTDPMAPVVTEVEGLTEAFVPSWRPRP